MKSKDNLGNNVIFPFFLTWVKFNTLFSICGSTCIHGFYSSPHLLVTPAQLMRPGIGRNASCAVGDFTMPILYIGLLIVHVQKSGWGVEDETGYNVCLHTTFCLWPPCWFDDLPIIDINYHQLPMFWLQFCSLLQGTSTSTERIPERGPPCSLTVLLARHSPGMMYNTIIMYCTCHTKESFWLSTPPQGYTIPHMILT